MRGKDRVALGKVDHDRITPAYAGKSTQVPFHYIIIRDHPRLCGEKFQGNTSQKRFQGSPPPMRGKALFWKTMAIACRITPAYAGKSQVFALKTIP